MSTSRRSKRLTRSMHQTTDELISSEQQIEDMENQNNKNGKKYPNNLKEINNSNNLKSTKNENKRNFGIILNDNVNLEEKEEPQQPQKDESTPPKQKKFERNPESLFSPSRLLDRLSIDDSDAEDEEEKTIHENRENVQKRNKYQNARRVLNSAETNILPGREKEINELNDFLSDHVNNMKSGSLYVSGPPGTGKTACLSKILKSTEISSKFTKVYINCTSISTIGSIYKKICGELQLKVTGKTEKDHLQVIEKFICETRRMILLVLDEIDQLLGQKQSILYTIFEWPAKRGSKLLLIGIANSLDLTDRMLMRLNAKCDLKPKLMHFSPYTKQQIIEIFKSRLEEAGVIDIFPAVSLQLLAAKVSAVSGDVRRALDIGRRVVEIAEQQRSGGRKISLGDINLEKDAVDENQIQPVQAKQVVNVLNNVYGASQTLNDDIEDAFPLQQKILLCSLLLMLRKEKNKDITIGRLHDVYKRVCSKRNLFAVDQAEFFSLCSLVETRGIVRVIKKKEPRLCKIVLQWDEDEVNGALKDKQLIASILDDASCLSR